MSIDKISKLLMKHRDRIRTLAYLLVSFSSYLLFCLFIQKKIIVKTHKPI